MSNLEVVPTLTLEVARIQEILIYMAVLDFVLVVLILLVVRVPSQAAAALLAVLQSEVAMEISATRLAAQLFLVEADRRQHPQATCNSPQVP